MNLRKARAVAIKPTGIELWPDRRPGWWLILYHLLVEYCSPKPKIAAFDPDPLEVEWIQLSTWKVMDNKIIEWIKNAADPMDILAKDFVQLHVKDYQRLRLVPAKTARMRATKKHATDYLERVAEAFVTGNRKRGRPSQEKRPSGSVPVPSRTQDKQLLDKLRETTNPMKLLSLPGTRKQLAAHRQRRLLGAKLGDAEATEDSDWFLQKVARVFVTGGNNKGRSQVNLREFLPITVMVKLGLEYDRVRRESGSAAYARSQLQKTICEIHVDYGLGYGDDRDRVRDKKRDRVVFSKSDLERLLEWWKDLKKKFIANGQSLYTRKEKFADCVAHYLSD